MNRIFLLLLVTACAGCSQHAGDAPAKEQAAKAQVVSWQPPAAGAVVAEYKEDIAEDRLNKAVFRVLVEATPQSKEGHYLLHLEYGGNKNEAPLDLPKWTPGVVLKPVVKGKGGKYECEIGFDTGDGVFKPYYEVTVEKKDIKLKQVTGYYAS